MTNPLFLAVEWAHSLVLALGRKADTSISPRVFALFIGVILLLAAVQAVYRFFAPTQKAQVAPRPGQHGWTKCAPVLPAVCRVCHAHCSSIGGDINVSTEQTLCCEVCGTFVHEACLKTAGVRPRKAARNVAGGRKKRGGGGGGGGGGRGQRGRGRSRSPSPAPPGSQGQPLLLPCKPVFAVEEGAGHTEHMLVVSPTTSDDGECLVCQKSHAMGDSDIIHGDVFRCLWCSRLVHASCCKELAGTPCTLGPLQNLILPPHALRQCSAAEEKEEKEQAKRGRERSTEENRGGGGGGGDDDVVGELMSSGVNNGTTRSNETNEEYASFDRSAAPASPTFPPPIAAGTPLGSARRLTTSVTQRFTKLGTKGRDMFRYARREVRRKEERRRRHT